MEIVLSQLVNGIAIGSIYSLLTTGFNLLLLVGGVCQFAYPHLVVFSMYICWLVLRATGGNALLSVAATIGGGTGLSLLTEPLFRPLTKRGALLATFFVSLGIAIILTDIMSRIIYRGVPIGFPLTLTGKEAIARVGMVAIGRGQLFTIIGSIAAVVVFLYLLYRTKLGRSFRAIAQSPFAARLLGIPMTRTSIISYAIAGLLAGISAVFLTMTLGGATGALGGILAIKVFAVAMFAGLGNLRGGLICGLILGVVESIVIGFFPGDWANAVAFAMVIAVVMWKPEGLFGLRT
jgi:branched-chain amino acid transport system permease protein